MVIGRANEMQEYLRNKLYVSRNHAELFVTEGILYITGLATATNGTYVDGVAIPAERSVALREGSLVGLGGNDARTQPEAAYFQVMVL